MKTAIVTPAIHDSERLFGAERLFFGLVQTFKQHADVDWIQVPIVERIGRQFCNPTATASTSIFALTIW